MSEGSDDVETARRKQEEQFAKKEFGLLLYRLQNLPPTARAKLQGVFTQHLIDETLTVETPRGPLSFVLLGRSGAPALSLLRRQPDTIAWIDAFQPNSVFWDVGANVGIYSLYAALRHDTKVVAFEPAAVNYFLLAANVEANRFEDSVECLLVGLSDESAISRLEVSQFVPAASFSFRGKKARPYAGRQAALMASMDQLIEDYGLACPNYIKIDVPGLTEAIIDGGVRMLQRHELQEVHIECTEKSTGGRHVVEVLGHASFVVASGSSRDGSADTTFVRAP